MTPGDTTIERRPVPLGTLLAVAGGFILSFDIPLMRLADGDIWSVTGVRCSFVCVAALVLWLGARLTGNDSLRFATGRTAWAASLCYAATTFTFILAVFNTSTANVVFLLAFTGMFAALLGWLMIGEKPSAATIATMAATVTGVGIIVAGGLSAGRLFGNAMALLTAAVLALAITLTRRNDIDLRLNVLAANGGAGLLGLVMSAGAADAFLHVPAYAVLNGLVVIPASFLCLAYAPRLLSGPAVAMAYMLETVFAPVWVWLLLDETPPTATLVGGGVILIALTAYFGHELRLAKRRRNPGALPA